MDKLLHLEIDVGTDTATGKLLFVTTVVEKDGGRMVVWDGPDYYGALLAASGGWGDLPVVDLLEARLT